MPTTLTPAVAAALSTTDDGMLDDWMRSQLASTTMRRALIDEDGLVAESRDFLAREYLPKIRLAIEPLDEAAIWWRANEQSNSIGNLMLHLAGNIRQWIVSGVGGAPSTRDRAAEFAAHSGSGVAELLANLEQVLDETDAVLAKVTAADLATTRTIQGRDITVLEAIYHVVEHFSLHLGQVVFIAKARAPGSVKFYEDAGGLARPIWPEQQRR